MLDSGEGCVPRACCPQAGGGVDGIAHRPPQPDIYIAGRFEPVFNLARGVAQQVLLCALIICHHVGLQGGAIQLGLFDILRQGIEIHRAVQASLVLHAGLARQHALAIEWVFAQWRLRADKGFVTDDADRWIVGCYHVGDLLTAVRQAQSQVIDLVDMQDPVAHFAQVEALLGIIPGVLPPAPQVGMLFIVGVGRLCIGTASTGNGGCMGDAGVVIGGQIELVLAKRVIDLAPVLQAALLEDKRQHDRVLVILGARLQQANAISALRDAVRHGIAIDTQNFGAQHRAAQGAGRVAQCRGIPVGAYVLGAINALGTQRAAQRGKQRITVPGIGHGHVQGLAGVEPGLA